MAKQKESRQKKMDVRVDGCPRRLYADGGYDDASYHILYALYIAQQTADHEPDHAEQRQECDG